MPSRNPGSLAQLSVSDAFGLDRLWADMMALHRESFAHDANLHLQPQPVQQAEGGPDLAAVQRDGSSAAWRAYMASVGAPGATPPAGGPWAPERPSELRTETRDMMLGDMARLGLPGTEMEEGYVDPMSLPSKEQMVQKEMDRVFAQNEYLAKQMPGDKIWDAKHAASEKK